VLLQPGPAAAVAVGEVQPARQRQHVKRPVILGKAAEAQQQRVDSAIVAGKYVAGRARQKMSERAPDLEFLPARRSGQMRRHFLAQLDQLWKIRLQRMVIERRVDGPAMTPPLFTFEVVHAATGRECECPPDRRNSHIVIDIALEDVPDPLRIADDEEPAPEKPALDKQLLEQFLVASRQGVVWKGAQQPPCRERPPRSRRHRQARLRSVGRHG